MEIVQGALAAGIVLGVLDAVWLGVVARAWLARQLGGLMREKLLWGPGLAFYGLYSVALAVFAIAPAGGDWVRAMGLGAFLGLAAFGTYELTNWATLKGWPRAMVFVDMIWGAASSAVSAAGAVLILGLLRA